MDYHSLPRRQLQALCKKHGIPANAANSEMADALTALLKPKPQLHADSSKQTEKRTTRRRETTLSETVSKSKDVEEESNMKLPKATISHKILEEESNRKPQRATRGRGSACAVLEACTSSALKKEKTPLNGETESNSAAKQQEIKKVSTRNGARKHSNMEMPTNAEEIVDSKTTSPKSDKKKEKTGRIVLRRGRVKVRSPRNLSNSPESGKNIKGVAVTTEEEAIGMTSSQSCLVDAKKTRKKKRSVTFSDVLEVNSVCVEHPSRGVKEIITEIPQGPEPNLPENTNSACIAEKVVVTRKASRNVSSKDFIQDTIAAQEVDHQKSSKEPVAKVSKAEGLHAYDANIEIGRESGRKKSLRGKKISSSVGEAAAKENEEVKVADGFVEGAHIIEVPCTRRSRRLTIVPIDVKSNQDMQLTTEKLKGQPKDQHEGNSIAPKKTEGDLPAETSRRSRRKTLAPLELNHVQSNVGSGSEQMEKRVSKAKDTQSKGYALELKDEALKAHQKHSEIKACKSTPVTIEAEAQPMKTKEARSVRNLRGSRQKGLGASTPTEEVLNEMGCQNIGTTEIEKNVDTIESEKADNQSPPSTTFSGPCSLQEVSKDAKVEIEAVETISVMPRSTRKTFKVLTHPDNGTAVSQEPAFNTQSNTVKQEGLIFNDEAVGKNIQDSEDLDVIAQAYIEQSQEILVLKNTNEPRVEDPVNNTPVNDDSNCSDGFLSPLHVVKGKRQNPINSEDANPISCTEEFEYITSTIDVRSSSTTATHCATCDSETANSSPLVEKLDTADVKCHEFTEDTSSATSSECVQQGHIEKDHDVLEQESQAMDEMATWGSETANSSQLVPEFTEDATSSDYVQQGHEFTIEKDHDVLEQESHAMDEMATIISLTKDISKKSRSGSPLSIMIRGNGSPDGNHHMKCTDFENSVDIHTGEGITASSPAAIVESTFEHQISIGITTAEQESHKPKVHLLPSDKDKIASTTCGGAADLVEQQPNQAVDLNLCAEDAVDKEDMKIQGDLQTEQLQDMNEEVPSDGVKMVQDVSTNHLGQSSPLSPSCSAEPGIALPRESACKTKQKGTRSIYKSARKAKFSVPWENRCLEENTAPYSNKENSLNSLDQVEKDAGIWGLNRHEMSSDEIDPATSEEEESSAETEETLADMEVCNFNTEVLISNTEGDYSSSEDDTTSDSEEDTMFDSEDLSEMEGELLSGEECYESEELDTTEEEFSETEGDSGDDFEEYEASSVSQSVGNSESFDAALYTTHGLEDQQVEIIYPSKLYLPNEGITQPVTNHLTLVNSTNGCALDLDIDEKIGEQHEESQRTFSPHAATGIQENFDVHMSYSDNTAMQRVQSTTDSSCQDSDTLTSLSSLFVTPPSKVKEDVKCSLASPSIGILESNIFQQSRTLEIEPNHSLKSKQEESMQLSLPCELSHENVIAEQHTMDEAEHGTELCESVEKELAIDGQMVELIETCSVEISLAGPAVVDCFMASPMSNNVQNSQLLESNSKNPSITGKENEKIHIDASESPCLGPCELFLEGNRSEMGDPEIIEDGLEEDEAGNVQDKNDCENIGSSIGIALTAQNGSEDLRELQDLGEGTSTSSKLTEELIITEVAPLGSSALAVKDKPNESETAIEQSLEVLDFNVDDLPQKQNNEHALAFDTAYSSIRTTDRVVSLESAKELELNMVSADDKIHLFSSDTSCNLLEEGERLHLLQCEQHLMPCDASKQSKTEATGEGPVEVIQPQSNAESLVSQVMASNTFEADCCSTPKCSNDSGIVHVFNHESLDEVAQNLHCVEIKCEQVLTPSDASELSKTEAIGEGPEVLQSESNAESPVSQVMLPSDTFEVGHCSTPTCSKDSGIVQMFNHESLNEVAQTLHCVEIESVNAQAEEIYEKPLDESQYSEESNEDKETAEAKSMKQIDLTLLSIRRLRQMCKENEMSAKKKPENETPARKPSNLWMSATKQPSTSMHPRDLPSANKRSALQALSSNVKATPSAAMQTPTVKVLQKPRNLMGTYDGNEGTGKHLVTPSPKAPMSSKRDFARSHHR